MKKRKKELGLYHILGMDKRNIFYLLYWETVISYGIVVSIGISTGILFSKTAELGLVNIMDKEVNYRIYIEWKSVLLAVLVFMFIYLLILLNALWQIRDNNPIELLHSDSAGERPPKSSLLLAVISLVFILAAYYMTAKLSIPLQYAKVSAAGVLITSGTFLLFICASVFLCKILQNNKRYYYKTAHFVTVSTMSYRMKRNGAGLAAICLLVTAILSALALSVSFYAGSMDIVEKHYPYDIGISIEIPAENMADEMPDGIYAAGWRSAVENALQDSDVLLKDDTKVCSAYSANMLAVTVDGCLDLSQDMRDTWFVPGVYDGWERGNKKIVHVHVISLDDYNALCKADEKSDDGKIWIVSETIDYQADDIVLYNGEKIKADKTIQTIPRMTEVRLGDASLDAHGCEQLFLIVPDVYAFMGKKEGTSFYAEADYMTYNWEYNLSLSGPDEELYRIFDKIENSVKAIGEITGNEKINSYLKIEKREGFYALAGGLLFVAVFMNILLVFVTALIMYYKQISEGYEDQKRFIIMQKIGMTKKEIKKSIHSQMMAVFSLPLLVAGLHFIFTSNVVYILLAYAVADDRNLLIKVMIISYFLFAVVYSFVYALTSKTYYNIVNKTVSE